MSYCPSASEGTATYRDDSSCSYCGSMHPDEFMERVRRGEEVVPTDKSYKAYITGAPKSGKFYYDHLSEDQKREFVDLYNAGRMKLAYPGSFYAMPFFMRTVATSVT